MAGHSASFFEHLMFEGLGSGLVQSMSSTHAAVELTHLGTTATFLVQLSVEGDNLDKESAHHSRPLGDISSPSDSRG